MSKTEELRQEQENREKAKMRAQDLLRIHTEETTKTVKKWHTALPVSDQEAIKTQHQSQNRMFANKADAESSFYQAHLTKLYKEQYPLEGFSAWLDKYAKKKKIEMDKQILLAVAELDRK